MHKKLHDLKPLGDLPPQIIETARVIDRNTAFTFCSVMEPKVPPTVKIRNVCVVVPESSCLSLRVEIEPADTMFRMSVVVPYVVVTGWCLVRRAIWGYCLTSYLTTCHTI